MDTVLIAARVALAAVFAVAAVAKLLDQPGSRRAVGDFGVGARWAPAAGALLPLFELLAAGLLVARPTARAGAVVAAVLLLAFVLAIAAALRRGTAPECHCFGQLHSRPAGRETIARNAVLLAVAVFAAAAGPGPGIGSWLTDSPGERVALAAVSLLAILCAYGWWSVRAESRRIGGGDAPEPVEPGGPAPEFSATAPTGDVVTGRELVARGHSIVVFTSATCGPCVGLLPELARWRQMLSGRLTLHVVASGDRDENQRLAGEHDLDVLLDRDGAAARAFGVAGTPGAVEVAADGRVMSYPVMGAPAIEALIRTALKRPADESVVQVRSPAA